ncbi:uncharacterized protein LOC112086433 [Eutrema salsugineum]|uniref:uncharacterized protein LOC112086433 n=1 Tax=Eutrema salsugineum TaxID=72664 RepID=UPI000CED0391|nr:uncharacterized protein LOC112086433 [Eutrema salsugineum]
MAASSSNGYDDSYDDSYDYFQDDAFDDAIDDQFDEMFDQKFEAIDDAIYPSHIFRRRFRMNKDLFLRIVDCLSNEVPYFQQRRNDIGRLGLSALQKCTAAIRIMAYGTAADAVDEYLRLRASTALLCLENFTEGIISLFGDEYLRRPTSDDFNGY